MGASTKSPSRAARGCEGPLHRVVWGAAMRSAMLLLPSMLAVSIAQMTAGPLVPQLPQFQVPPPSVLGMPLANFPSLMQTIPSPQLVMQDPLQTQQRASFRPGSISAFGHQAPTHPAFVGGSRPAAPQFFEGSSGAPALLNSVQQQVQTGTAAEEKSGAQTQTTLEMAAQATADAHKYFLPPYSWMWTIGTETLGANYKKAQMVSDMPKLANLITGYYARDPLSLKEAARVNHSNRPTVPLMDLIETHAGLKD